MSQLAFPGRANHWSAIIGGSHSKNYVLWEYGGYASEGVKQVAELGSPVKMEEEIRQQVRKTITEWPKTRNAVKASFRFLSQELEIYSTMCWEIGTKGSKIYLLSLEGLCWGQRYWCLPSWLRSFLTVFVFPPVWAKSCCCGHIVGIPRPWSPESQCGGLWFAYYDPWEGQGVTSQLAKPKSPFLKRNTYVPACTLATMSWGVP